MEPQWVAGNAKRSVANIGGQASVQFLGACPAELLDEFRNPNVAGEGKEKGTLAVMIGTTLERFSIAKSLGAPAQSIGKTNWKLRILRYFPVVGGDDPDAAPTNPLVEFELTSTSGKKLRYAVAAKLAGRLFPLEGADDHGQLAENDRLQVWYTGPDPRFGDNPRGVLQLATGLDEKLYYRSFHIKGDRFAFEKAGAVNLAEEGNGIWEGMNWNFRVVRYLPHATSERWFIPEDRRAGLEDAEGRLKPAIHCRLHFGEEHRDFWVSRTEYDFTPVSLGGKTFGLGFNDAKSDLGFDIKLLRAEQEVDPGTNQPATYTSYVQLTDTSQKIAGEDRIITMNQPLEHRGYKFFQTNLVPAGIDEATRKPISLSVFTVSRDPGIWLKYLGSTMLALGIACMFYMKAYFFKPRRKTA
jgi:hypothetical protein